MMTRRDRLIVFSVLAFATMVALVVAALVAVSHHRKFEIVSNEFNVITKQQGNHSPEDEARIREMVRRFPQLTTRKGAMVWAAQYGNRETAIAFLANGGNPNDQGQWWQAPPLFWAVAHGDVPLARRLLLSGANPSVPIKISGCAPSLLQMACSSGSLEMVQLFVESGCDVNPVVEGASPLHCAAASGKLEVVRYLLREGADPEALDAHGFTPRDNLDVLAKIAASYEKRDWEEAYRRIQEELVKKR